VTTFERTPYGVNSAASAFDIDSTASFAAA
jgi:hypothetical protein